MVDWIDSRERGDLFVTAITIMELRFGIEVMPAGHRRRAIEAEVRKLLEVKFLGRIFPFDEDAAEICGRLRASRRAIGRPMHDLADAAIAAIALSRSASLATRNLADFADLGLDLIDPWVMPATG